MYFSTAVAFALICYASALRELQVRDPFCTATTGNPCDPDTENDCCRDANTLMSCSGLEQHGSLEWVSMACDEGCIVTSPGDVSCCADNTGKACFIPCVGC